MSVTRINGLNYCSKARMSLLEQSSIVQNPAEKQVLEWIADMLEAAQKFLLPDNGRLLDGVDAIRNSDFMRLPYPYTALEYRVNETATDTLDDEVVTPHRIALCLEVESPSVRSLVDTLKLPERDKTLAFI